MAAGLWRACAEIERCQRKAKRSRAVKKNEVFQEKLRKKRNHSKPVKKNAVFPKKFWVTFSKVTILH
ncbi:MAG: hypothetical protein RR465_01320, partial [Mucinivorans sp.]